MAIRRRALERVGPFDAGLEIYGDEEEWQRQDDPATIHPEPDQSR